MAVQADCLVNAETVGCSETGKDSRGQNDRAGGVDHVTHKDDNVGAEWDRINDIFGESGQGVPDVNVVFVTFEDKCHHRWRTGGCVEVGLEDSIPSSAHALIHGSQWGHVVGVGLLPLGGVGAENRGQ